MTRSPTLGSHRAADGPRRGRAALLAGCVQDVWFTSINQAAIELLVAARFDVSVPTAQTCCGALAAHDGAAKAAGRLAAENAGAFAGYDVVVATAAGCSAHLSGYAEWAPGAGIESTARDITVVVAEALAAGLLPSFPSTGRRVAMQDPCHLRHAQGVVEETRRIVEAAGLVAVEVDPNGVCCGAAGIYVLRRPETADELGRMKADQVRASGARLVASANPGCEMQLRSNLDDSYTIRHPIEFYADALRSRPG